MSNKKRPRFRTALSQLERRLTIDVHDLSRQVRDAATEYHARPSPQRHAIVAEAVQRLIRSSGGRLKPLRQVERKIWQGGHWVAPEG